MKVYKQPDVACAECGAMLQALYTKDIKRSSGILRTFNHPYSPVSRPCRHEGKSVQVGFNYIKTAKEVAQ